MSIFSSLQYPGFSNTLIIWAGVLVLFPRVVGALAVFSPSNLEGQKQALVCLFLLLGLLNFGGLVPLVYGVTTSPFFVGGVSLSFWGGIIISVYVLSLRSSLAKLVPSGSPSLLVPLLVLIETVSQVIRPLTLSLRLMANLSAGHVFLALASGLPVLFLSLFEMFVSGIQAYIFFSLLSLYSTEH